MRNRFAALLCAAVLLAAGCRSEDIETDSGLNIVDVGGQSLGAVGTVDSGTIVTDETAAGEIIVGKETAESEISETIADNAPENEEERENAPQTSQSSQTASQSHSGETAPETVKATTAEKTTASGQSGSAASTTAATASTAASTTSTTTASTTIAEQTEPISSVNIGTNAYKTVNYSEVKGVWISYIELADLLTGKSASGFRAAIGAAYDNVVSLGLNTVYVHVRSHGDAYYESALYPWSKYASGTLGADPGFDPLEIMIEEAHVRGLSFQAWINPLRACSTGELSGESGYPIYAWANGTGTAGKYVVAVNGYYYLNPAYSAVTDFIAEGAAEIVANYDVDGIHIDDYFYPTTDASFDSAAFAASGYSTISAFRLANCDRLVSGIYSAVKAANPNAVFGVSCQGSIDNNYNQMYADVKKWCTTSGYIDYIMPQIYYGFNNSSQPFATCISQWNELAAKGGIPLIAGLSVSKIGLEDTWAGSGKTEWITDKNILSRQLSTALEQRSYGGVCLYSYRNIFTPDSAVKSQVDSEISAFCATLKTG